MTRKQIQAKLEKMWDELDVIQETDVAQNNEELMWEIGEAMGSIDNAIDILDPDNEAVEAMRPRTNKYNLLKKKLLRKCGDYIWILEWANSEEVVVSVAECMLEEATKLIEEAGYKVIEKSWFSGSNYDGYKLTFLRRLS